MLKILTAIIPVLLVLLVSALFKVVAMPFRAAHGMTKRGAPV